MGHHDQTRADSATIVAELMTFDPIVAHHNDTLARADVEMRLLEVRHLPVIDEHQRLVGILSNRDILRALAGRKHTCARVEQIMTRNPATVAPDTAASEAAELMMRRRISALPVVDNRGQLRGIVSQTDFLRWARDLLRRPT